MYEYGNNDVLEHGVGVLVSAVSSVRSNLFIAKLTNKDRGPVANCVGHCYGDQSDASLGDLTGEQSGVTVHSACAWVARTMRSDNNTAPQPGF